LPDRVQEEFRAAWRERAANDVAVGDAAHRDGWRGSLATAALFLGLHLLLGSGSGFLGLRLPLAAGLGFGLGWLWHRCQMGRFQSMLTGAAVHVVLSVAHGDFRAPTAGGLGVGFQILCPILALWVFLNLCALMGFYRERPPGT
jgi:hypothetical protein